MNNELIERIDHCLTHIPLGLTVIRTFEDCKIALTQQQEAESEKLRKDAERYRYIREGNHWIVAATQTGVHLDGKDLDDLIDGEIADAMVKAKEEGK